VGEVGRDSGYSVGFGSGVVGNGVSRCWYWFFGFEYCVV